MTSLACALKLPTMLELEDALSRILGRISPLPAERVPVAESHGRFAARAVAAPVDLPLFDNSAMDGYAVRADDVRQASRESPARLKLLGENAPRSRHMRAALYRLYPARVF
jgi:molybdopterin molybdotransferase